MPPRPAAALLVLLAAAAVAGAPGTRAAAPKRPPAPWTGRGVAGKLVVTSMKQAGDG